MYTTARTGRSAAGVMAIVAALLSGGCGTSGSASPLASQPGNGSAGTAPPAATRQIAYPGTALFPVAVGRTWVFETNAGPVHGTVTDKIVSVAQVAGGHKVTMSEVSALSGQPKITATQVFLFHDDNSISVPLTQGGSTTITVKSGDVLWPPPAVLASRKPQVSELVLGVKGAGQTYSTERTRLVVRGLGTQQIKVPAGTYGAVVVDETFTVKFASVTGHLELRTWLVPGIGPVKSELINSSAGKAFSGVEVLKSITP